MAVQTILAGSDVTEMVQEGSVSKKHNNPGQASVKLPTFLASAGATADLQIIVEGSTDFYGSVEYIEHHGEEDTRYSTYTAVDPTFINNWRVAADADGDYSKPTFIEDFVTGPAIMQEIINNSIAQFGDIGYSVGSVAGGGSDLTGAPSNWPKTIAEMQTLLCETGELDAYYDPGAGTLNFYNGNFGSSTGVSFTYGDGGNARACRVTIDKKDMVNRMRYLIGPKQTTKLDPKAAQHWAGSIDRTTMVVPGIGALNGAASASESAYLTRFLVRIFDAIGEIDDPLVGRELYLTHFAAELGMRLQPKLMFHITPHRGIAPSFTVGDKINVSGFGISGEQRVMEMTYRWSADGPIELGEPVGQAGASAISTTGVAG